MHMYLIIQFHTLNLRHNIHVFQFVYFLILYCPPFQSYSETIFAALLVDLAANFAIEINITVIQLTTC